jgi:hypothetical protein
MRKLIIIAGAVAALAVPSAAMAAAPNGQWAPNDNPPSATGDLSNTEFKGSAMGFYSSRITQNGEFIGGTAAGQSGLGYDNTTAPGSRAAIVQGVLGH